MPKAITQALTKRPVQLIAIALLVRAAATLIPGTHPSDMACFIGWADWLYREGPSAFYLHEGFHDYPPGYMYVLYILGAARNAFGLGFQSYAYVLLQKLPSILADAFAALFLYNLAKPRLGEKPALIIGLLYALNPAVVVVSSVWGQVDAVQTLILLYSVYYLTKTKPVPAFALFAAGVLVKPQTLVFTPIYLFFAWDYVKARSFDIGAFWVILRAGLAALAALLVGVLPFVPFSIGALAGFKVVFGQYVYALTQQYLYASVCAYNFWSLLGFNWNGPDKLFLNMPVSAWSNVAMLVTVLAGVRVLSRRKGEGAYFLAAAFMNLLAFMFMAKMHERYVFSAMALFLAAACYDNRKETKLAYAALSVAFLANCADVLRASLDNFNWDAIVSTARALSLLYVIAFVCAAYAVWRLTKADDKAPRYTLTPLTSEPPVKWARPDYIVCALITVAYAAVAFVNLGDMKAPQTMWVADEGVSAELRFDAPQTISRVQFYLGYEHDKALTLYFKNDDEQDWRDETAVKAASVFRWDETPLNVAASRVLIVAGSKTTALGEIAFRDANDALIKAAPVLREVDALSPLPLLDEQSVVPLKRTNMNGTYFDEIYHPRTAYEFLHGLTVYETTHPPLGKLIIAAGVAAFGMTPFGWRFSGALFGVLMIPLLYAFAKKLLKDTRWAALTTVLFAFDFMHFAQTRIGTIDTYVTFFIIGMYYFMYQYYTTSFYDTPYKKQLPSLALSGLCFGLATACKWPGIYAGAGLAVLFFAALTKRYWEHNALRGKQRKAYADFWTPALKTCLWCLLFFVAVPLAIYLAAYIPYFAKPGTGPAAFLKDVWGSQKLMFNYHSSYVLGSTHPYSSNWWEWITDLRPIFYYAGRVSDTVGNGISAFGNPLTYWAGLAAVITGAYRLHRRHDQTLAFLLAAYVTQIIPWIFVERLTFIYHYFPALPFLTILIAYICKTTKPLGGKWFVPAAACVTVLIFALYYPVLSGTPVNLQFVYKFLQLPFIGDRWQLI